VSESAEPNDMVPDPSRPNAVVPMADVRPGMDAFFRAQSLLLEEIVFAANEMLDRTRTETHLFAEFISRLAASHSVRDWGSMFRDCGQHQLDFIRRDCERAFRHGGRIIEKAANLFNARPGG